MTIETKFWLGDLSSYQLCLDAIAAEAAMSPEARANNPFDDEDDEFDGYGYLVQRHGDTAILSVHGPLTNRDSMWNRFFGVTSYGEIRNALSAAVNNGDIKDILLDVDSPGGAAKGTSEAADFIARVDAEHKPVYAHTSGDMMSAAYWLGSAARKITATSMSSVGSIGVIAVHREFTAALAQGGIKATVLREGKYKALGSPYEKLTDEAKAHLQQSLSDMYGFFTGAVAENRGLPIDYILEKAAEGREFWGPDAMAVGLVDEISTLEEVVNQLDRGHNSKQHEVHMSNHRGLQPMTTKSKRVVITAAAQQAIQAGVPEAEALELHGAVETDADAEAQAAAEAAAAAEAQAAAEGGAEGEGSEAAAGEGVTAETVPTPDTSAIDALSRQISELNTALVDTKVELAQANTALAKATAAESGLLDIARASVQKMQIALGGSPQDLNHLDATTLLQQHAAVEKAFLERYPVGGKGKVSSDKLEVVTDAPAMHSPAVKRAVSFSKTNEG
jgi:signal peptide peptidase SppA